MTGKQIIKKLTAAGFPESKIIEANRDEVEVEGWQNKAMKILGWGGGFRTGYGSWVLRPTYQGNGDWNDRTSRWHY